MTEGSTKGWLPQLIDVLQALTDSQELLASKVRSAYLELYVQPSSADESLSAIPVDSGGPETPSITATQTRPRQMHESFAQETAEFTTAPSGPDPADTTSTLRDKAVAVSLSPPDAMTAIHSSPASSIPPADNGALSTPTPNGQELHDAFREGATSTETAERDYNFFDELDARIADLRNPERGSDQAGS